MTAKKNAVPKRLKSSTRAAPLTEKDYFTMVAGALNTESKFILWVAPLVHPAIPLRDAKKRITAALQYTRHSTRELNAGFDASVIQWAVQKWPRLWSTLTARFGVPPGKRWEMHVSLEPLQCEGTIINAPAEPAVLLKAYVEAESERQRLERELGSMRPEFDRLQQRRKKNRESGQKGGRGKSK